MDKVLTALGWPKAIVAWGVGRMVTRTLLSTVVLASSRTNWDEFRSGAPSYTDDVSFLSGSPVALPAASCRLAIMFSKNSTSSCRTHCRRAASLRALHRFLGCGIPCLLGLSSSSLSSSALGTSRWYNLAVFQGVLAKSGVTTLSANLATNGKASFGALGLTGSFVKTREFEGPLTRTNRISSPLLRAFPLVVRRVSIPNPAPFIFWDIVASNCLSLFYSKTALLRSSYVEDGGWFQLLFEC
mmetsp:Transcript_11348/g.28695  ORF Transcript_11348/g.28695 Transcript_11348/m.28695 type:complete len:242 (+) Transcript_11348:1434-2159(+)